MTDVIPDSRISIALRDYLLEPAVSLTGVGWLGTSEQNLLTNTYSKLATATTNTTETAVDLGSSTKIDIVTIPRHTLSINSTWRLRVSEDTTLLTDPGSVAAIDILYDSGAVSVWPKLTDILDIPYDQYEEWAGGFSGSTNPPTYTKVGVSARYLHIELVDPDSTGYTVSKVVVAPYWRPTGGVSAGWSTRYVQKGKAHTRLPGGGVFVDARANTRQLRIKLNTLTEAEVFNQATTIDKTLTKKIPYTVVLDPTDTSNASRLFMYGTNNKITPAKSTFPGFFTKTLILDEWT